MNADSDQTLQWFPIVMSRLLFALLNYSKSVQISIIGLMVKLLRKMRLFLNDFASFRPEFLVRYLKYAFEAPENTKTQLSSALCSNFLAFKHRAQLGAAEDKDVDQTELLEFCWFMLEMITRTMVLNLAAAGKLGDNMNRKQHFDVPSETLVFQKLIAGVGGLIKDVSLMKQGQLVVKKANMAVGFFIRDLFSIFDRGATHDLASAYVQTLNDSLTSIPVDHPAFKEIFQLKFEFLKTVTDHEHYVALCMPLPLKIENRIDFAQSIANKSPLASLILYAIVEALERPEPQLRQLAISALNVLLTKHDFDSRLETPACQERVAEMYFYLLPLLMDNRDHLKQWASLTPSVGIHEKRSFYVCLLFILKSIPSKTLFSWWKLEIRRAFFLELLEDCIKSFQYDKQSLNQAQERALTREANLIVLDVLHNFINCFQNEIASTKTISLADKIFGILTLFFERTQSRQTLKCLLFVLKSFLLKFQHVVFGNQQAQKKTDFAGNLLFHLLPYSNYCDPQTRTLAASLIYFMIQVFFFISLLAIFISFLAIFHFSFFI